MEKTYFFKTENYSLERTLLCGQCFRFRAAGNGGFAGTAMGRRLVLSQNGNEISVTLPCPDDEFAEKVAVYLALFDDYGDVFSELRKDDTLALMEQSCSGIRIMHQPFWETLCSFIISQNNNIPRISGIIERFCELFGKKGDDGSFDFPTAEVVSRLCEEDLAPLRCGYRAPYIIDAAKKCAAGEIDENLCRTLPLAEARAHLMSIKGVGPKVADCVLLFGAQRADAFPQDVWIKRAMARYFPNGLPECAVPYAGIAQQFIFHYARTVDNFD